MYEWGMIGSDLLTFGLDEVRGIPHGKQEEYPGLSNDSN